MVTASISGGAVLCGHCGSPDTVYAEDITNEHRLLQVSGNVLKFSVDCDTQEEAQNERILCRECGEESLLPEGYGLEFG